MLAVITVVALAVVGTAVAQVEHASHYKTNVNSLKSSLHRHPVLRLPPLSNDELMVAAAVSDAMNPGPSRFGEAVEVQAGMEEGEWVVDGTRKRREWRLEVSSPGAVTLSLLFDVFYIPSGGEFYVIGQNTTKGAFTHLNNNDDFKFAVAPIKGDHLTLLYTEPLDKATDKLDQVRIHIHKVVHGFNKMLLAHGASGKCNIDVACALNFRDNPEVASVGMLLTDDHQRYCSGALINNANQDGRQYFLTANHCVFSDVSYFIVGFDYQYDHCLTGVERAIKRATGVLKEPQPKLVQGLRLVSSWDRTDYALLEIKEPIPDDYNVYLAGFDVSVSAQPPSIVHGIHHPSGDVKKVSTFKGTLVRSSWSEAPHSYHLQVPSWTNGVTERGSSGSPLFDSRGLIVGHLRGGQSSCDYPTGYDLYGAIAHDWNKPERVADQLSKYLNPDAKRNVGVVAGGYLRDIRRAKQQGKQ